MMKNIGFISPWTIIIVLVGLPTIAILTMISHSYMVDARSASVRQSMGRLFDAINTESIKGGSISILIDTGSIDRSVQVSPHKTILGKGKLSPLVTRAGDIEFVALESIDRDEMYDVRGKNDGQLPLVGYAIAANRDALQVASTISDDGQKMVYIYGSYVPDFGSGAAAGLISDADGVSELINGKNGIHR